jgi:hypothetical protein
VNAERDAEHHRAAQQMDLAPRTDRMLMHAITLMLNTMMKR